MSVKALCAACEPGAYEAPHVVWRVAGDNVARSRRKWFPAYVPKPGFESMFRAPEFLPK